MTYPPTALKLFQLCDAWLVGSSVKPYAGISLSDSDVDIIVPFSYWSVAAQFIPKDAKVNAWGGWKFTENDKVVDVWPDDLANILKNKTVNSNWAYHPKTNTRIKIV